MFNRTNTHITETDEIEIKILDKPSNLAIISFISADNRMAADFAIDRNRIPEPIQKLLLAAPPNETEDIRLHRHVVISDGDIGADDIAISQRLRNHGIVGGADE